MTAVGELVARTHDITNIVVNNLGDRIVAIDSKGYLYIWRFNLLLIQQKYSIFHKNIDAVDACFTTNSSSIAILTKNGIYHYDMLKGHQSNLSDCKIDNISGGTFIRFLPLYQQLLVISGKKGKVDIYDIKDKIKVKGIELGNRDITACHINKLGSIFVLGFSDGIIQFYKSKGMGLMSEHDPFQRSGGKYYYN